MIETFQPLIAAARGLDLSDTDAAQRELAQRFDPRGADASALNAALAKLSEYAGQTGAVDPQDKT